MDCQGLRRRMADMMAGRLPAAEQDAAHDHLTHCPDCLEVWSRGLGELPELAAEVMAQTAPDLCSQAQSLIPDLADGALANVEAALASSHTASCRDCGPLAHAMDRLAHDLPGMAEIEPDAVFARDALAAMLPAPPNPRPRATWREIWRDLVKRPRFAMEAAFIVALLVVVGLELTRGLEPIPQLHAGSASLAQGMANAARVMERQVAAVGVQASGGFAAYVSQAKKDYQRAVNRAKSADWRLLPSLSPKRDDAEDEDAGS